MVSPLETNAGGIALAISAALCVLIQCMVATSASTTFCTTAWCEATQSARYPIPRFGTSEEVAATMLHIVCDATYSTGSEFCVDGGILAGIHVGD